MSFAALLTCIARPGMSSGAASGSCCARRCCAGSGMGQVGAQQRGGRFGDFEWIARSR